MDDFFPGWSHFVWWQKIGCVLTFAAIMAIVYFVLNWLVYGVLPMPVVTHLGAGVIGLAIGSWITEYLARRRRL